MKELITEGILSREAYNRALSIQKTKGGKIGEILVEMDAIDTRKFIEFVGRMAV